MKRSHGSMEIRTFLGKFGNDPVCILKQEKHGDSHHVVKDMIQCTCILLRLLYVKSIGIISCSHPHVVFISFVLHVSYGTSSFSLPPMKTKLLSLV